MTVAVRVEIFDFVGQGNHVAAGLVKAAVEAGEAPKAVFVLVGPLGFIDHDTSCAAKGLKMTALLLVPAAHLIAYGFHLLSRSRAGEDQ